YAGCDIAPGIRAQPHQFHLLFPMSRPPLFRLTFSCVSLHRQLILQQCPILTSSSRSQLLTVALFNRLARNNSTEAHSQCIPKIRRREASFLHILFFLKLNLVLVAERILRPSQVNLELGIVRYRPNRQPVPHQAPHISSVIEVHEAVDRPNPAMKLSQPPSWVSFHPPLKPVISAHHVDYATADAITVDNNCMRLLLAYSCHQAPRYLIDWQSSELIEDHELRTLPIANHRLIVAEAGNVADQDLPVILILLRLQAAMHCPSYYISGNKLLAACSREDAANPDPNEIRVFPIVLNPLV